MVKWHEALAVLRGLIGILILNLVVLGICFKCIPISVLFTYLWSSIGFSQFIYVIPILVFLSYEQRWGMIKGIIIGAGITSLINAGYYLNLLLHH
jgi:Na+/proline symporter